MTFNASKCKILHFGRNNPGYKYTMRGIELAEATEERDLGVWISTSMKPSKQCETAAKQANFTLGQMQRAFHFRKKEHFIPLYKTFIRPKLEYNVAAWCPWTEADAKTLERVQERAVRMVSNRRGTTYEERLKNVGLTTLRERRERGDAIETFKALKGFSRIDRQEWFHVSGPDARATRRTTSVTEEGETRRADSLYGKRSNLEVRKHFFTTRVVDLWNGLPDDVREQKTINGFKTAYDRWKQNQESENNLHT